MKKLSTPLLIVLAIVAAVAINGWRGGNRRFTAVTAELATTSNKLAEATAKLAQQASATETLRVQLNLQKSDVIAASNHIALLSRQIKEATAQKSELEGELQQRAGNIDALNRSNGQLESRIREFENQITGLQSALENEKTKVAETVSRLEAVNAALNDSESAKAAALAKLNDPSVLRAQLKTVNTPVAGPKSKDKETLKLNPDGSVDFASVVFPDPPPTNQSRKP